jgi:prepilin-type N-terminal cleavage/methylation domain-containing protein
MKRPCGYTLLELLIASIIVGVLTMALARAFGAVLLYPKLAEGSRSREAARIQFEDAVRAMLQTASVTSTTTDTSSFFLGGQDATGAADRLTFTTERTSIPGRVLASTNDFETQNQLMGPQGGFEEVSIGLTPIGQTAQSSGVFLRQQRPSDGDATQGGFESCLDTQVTDLEWDFFDGNNWIQDWDSRTVQRRIPASVRLTYFLEGESDPHVLVVRLLKSDVTPQNPVLEASTTGATP